MVRDLANNQAKWGWGSGAEPDTDVHTHVRTDLRHPGDACVSRRVDRRGCRLATDGHIRPDSTGGPRPDRSYRRELYPRQHAEGYRIRSPRAERARRV